MENRMGSIAAAKAIITASVPLKNPTARALNGRRPATSAARPAGTRQNAGKNKPLAISERISLGPVSSRLGPVPMDRRLGPINNGSNPKEVSRDAGIIKRASVKQPQSQRRGGLAAKDGMENITRNRQYLKIRGKSVVSAKQRASAKGKKEQPLDKEALDRSLDDYMLKNEKTAAVRLDDDLDAYMAQRRDDNE